MPTIRTLDPSSSRQPPVEWEIMLHFAHEKWMPYWPDDDTLLRWSMEIADRVETYFAEKYNIGFEVRVDIHSGSIWVKIKESTKKKGWAVLLVLGTLGSAYTGVKEFVVEDLPRVVQVARDVIENDSPARAVDVAIQPGAAVRAAELIDDYASGRIDKETVLTKLRGLVETIDRHQDRDPILAALRDYVDVRNESGWVPIMWDQLIADSQASIQPIEQAPQRSDSNRKRNHTDRPTQSAYRRDDDEDKDDRQRARQTN